MLTFKNYKFGEVNCTGCLISWIQATLNWKELQFKKKKRFYQVACWQVDVRGPSALGACHPWQVLLDAIRKQTG